MKVEMHHGSHLVWCRGTTTTYIKETPVMPYSATSDYAFLTATSLPLQAAFDGGRLTSDGGLPWLAEADFRAWLVCPDRLLRPRMAQAHRPALPGDPRPPARLS